MTPLLLLAISIASATTPRWAFVEGMDNVNKGDWYRDSNDDYGPGLSGYEAPFIQGLNAMYRATGDPGFLEEAVWHADGVMEQRNDARGVTDYTGKATPCWRDMYYTGSEPYCWVIHTGAILTPLLELASLIGESRYAELPAWDGEPLSAHAQAYADGAVETFAYHEEQWHPGGYYYIHADARFLGSEAGTPNPLNGSNVMAIAALHLYDLTGDEQYLERATEIGARWYHNLVSTPAGGLIWPYYSDDVIDAGEDVGHAEVSVALAAMLWERGILIEDLNVQRLATTLTDTIYVDDRTMLSTLSGGSENYLEYQFSTRSWLHLVPQEPQVYPLVRNLYEADAPAEETTSGGKMYAWGLLAEHQPPICAAALEEGWSEQGDWQASAGDATIAVETDQACLVKLTMDAPSEVRISVDGASVAVFQATGGERVRYLLAEADESYLLEHDGAAGPLLLKEAQYEAPAIVSEPPGEGSAGVSVEYIPEGAGDEPYWWALSDGPSDARVDPATGALSWIPTEAGIFELVLRLDTDVGSVEQAYEVCVDVDCTEPHDSEPGDSEPGDSSAPWDSHENDSATPAEDEPAPAEEDCGCGGHASLAWSLAVLAVLAAAGRRRRLALAAAGLLLIDLVASESLAGVRRALQLSAGHAHSCALLDDGSVTCWGSNAHGQLDVPSESFTAIGAGWHYTCGITAAGSLSCWGDGGCGQTTPASFGYSAIEGAHLHGVGITDFGALVGWGPSGYAITTPPMGENYVDLACGQTHCCAIDSDGAMSCWGSNGLNDSPSGLWSAVAAGMVVSCGLDQEGVASCWGNSDLYTPELSDGSVMIDIACGTRHCCGLQEDGSATCWGDDSVGGQLGAPAGSFASLETGTYHSCALTGAGKVSCWGNDAAGQSTVPKDLR